MQNPIAVLFWLSGGWMFVYAEAWAQALRNSDLDRRAHASGIQCSHR